MLKHALQGHWVGALLAGVGGGVFAALVIGIPNDVVPNPWFMRMTPVRVQDYLFFGVAVMFSMALAASYALPHAASCPTPKTPSHGIRSGGGIEGS